MIGVQRQTMPSDNNQLRIICLLHVLLLFVASSQGVAQDAGQGYKCSTCDVLHCCLRNWGFGEQLNRASIMYGPCIIQDDQRKWQISKKTPYSFLLNAVLSCPCSFVCEAQSQKQPASPLVPDATDLLTSQSSVSMKSKPNSQVLSSFMLSNNKAPQRLPRLLVLQRNLKSLSLSHSTTVFASLASLSKGPPTLPYHVCRPFSTLPASKGKFRTVGRNDPIIGTSSRVLITSDIVSSAPSVHHQGPRSHHLPSSPKASQGYPPVSPSVPSLPNAAPSSANSSHMVPAIAPSPPRAISHSPRRRHHHRHHHASPPVSSPASPPVSPPQGPGPKAAHFPPPPPPRHWHPKTPISPVPGRGTIPPLAPPAGPVASPPMALPPPPPSDDCSTIVCVAPLTKTPLGSPCGCVRPIQVEIELTVALYALFPQISVLAEEIAESTVLSQSQVEIMGANSDSRDQDKSIVDINLVPLGEEFDNLTALLIFQKFWNHEVVFNATLFGSYNVAYVRYPGLPPSPPSSELGPTSGVSYENPVGVDVKNKNHKLGIGTIAVIALSSAIAVVICLGAVWLVLLKLSHRVGPPPLVEPGLLSGRTKKSVAGGGSNLSSDLASSTSMSFVSSMATYASTARTFTFVELERATDKFRPENIIGEGGFGRVYCGVLDDGTKVAVKVLTRFDQQGGKEFIAEVEMLSRLHHRNLVKLIGICTEEHSHCLVYELIPNGSVESHLHGVDRETSPLNWETRMKIALGAARGLAYLHEDSNPRVIHRDFKASNILLDNDFNPKVSDFGLAKAAPDEGSGHLSTRVMGTFGYVAPEYAMTGHLLVKSDVYSYGVVLLELLSGRTPVDMSQPAGQENLVTWARPLLASKGGLELLVDPALGNSFPFDNMARVAAIASMCVQPEVSHRPFMGEVVQALKLVYNDSDVNNGIGSTNDSQEGDSSAESELKSGQRWLGRKAQYVQESTSFISIDYDSGPSQAGQTDAGRPVSASALMYDSARLIRQYSGSLRRHSLSGPLRTSRSKLAGYRVRGMNKQRSISEHAFRRHNSTELDTDLLELWP